MAALAELVARVPEISSTSKGPIVNLVGWITMVTMILAVGTVLISKLMVLRKLMWNDLILILAMLFSVGFTVATNSQVSHGLGSPLGTVSDDGYRSFQRSGYTSQLLYVGALCAAKLATLSLLISISPQKMHQRPIYGVGALVLLWSVASLLTVAFQCALPAPYLYTTSTRCIAQPSFWYVYAAVDILTDLAIIALPVHVVYNLQLPLNKRVAVVLAFSCRILAIATAAFRVAEMPKAVAHTTQAGSRNGFAAVDVTLNSWLFSVATELELFFSIFATCVPHLRPFMASIQAGYLSGVIHADAERTGYGSQGAVGDSYAMRRTRIGKSQSTGGHDEVGLINETHVVSAVGGTRRGKRASGLRNGSLDLPRHGQKDLADGKRVGLAISTSDVVVTTVRADPGLATEMAERERSESAGSGGSDGSKAMIIKTTQEWSVRYQE